MTPAARTVQWFGLYIAVVAVLLVVAPGLLLTPLGIPTPTEPWIRVLGVVVGVLAYYYLSLARAGDEAFFRATVIGRFGILGGFLALTLLRWAPGQLMIFGLIDAAGAAWTWHALERRRA